MPQILLLIIFVWGLYEFYKLALGKEKYPGYGRSKHIDIKSRANHWHHAAMKIGKTLWGIKELSFDEREQLEAERQYCTWEHHKCCLELTELELELFGDIKEGFKSHGNDLLEKMGIV